MADNDGFGGAAAGAGSTNAASGPDGYGGSWGGGYSDSIGGAFFSGQPLSSLGALSFMAPGLMALGPMAVAALGLQGQPVGQLGPESNGGGYGMSGYGPTPQLANAPAWTLDGLTGDYSQQVPGWIPYLPLSSQPLNVQNTFHQWRATGNTPTAPAAPAPPKAQPTLPTTGGGGGGGTTPSPASAVFGNGGGSGGQGFFPGRPAAQTGGLDPMMRFNGGGDMSSVMGYGGPMPLNEVGGGLNSGGSAEASRQRAIQLLRQYGGGTGGMGKPIEAFRPVADQRVGRTQVQPSYMQEQQGPLNSTNLMNSMLADRMRRGDFGPDYGGFNPETPEAQYNKGVDVMRAGGSFNPGSIYGINDIGAKIGARTGATNMTAANNIIAQRLRGVG